MDGALVVVTDGDVIPLAHPPKYATSPLKYVPAPNRDYGDYYYVVSVAISEYMIGGKCLSVG